VDRAIMLVFVFLAGAAVGSFSNVLIYRIPLRESIVRPGSRCPECGTPIRFYDNIPVISYLVLAGKCRSCGIGIPWRYPAVEALNGILYLALAMRFGLGLYTLVMAPFVTFLVVLAFIDMDHRILPNIITLPGMAAGVVLSFGPWPPRPIDSFIGLLAGGGFLYLVAWLYMITRKKEGMGMGDVKLLGMIGAFLGWIALPVTILSASLIGSVVGVTWARVKKQPVMEFPVPFGVFLAAGALIHLFFGLELILWYLGKIS
jgi:leader peptidase (prepilin peptidase)/N-methyltransferase